ncbi:hypothetical protein MMC13_005483 [Lambiella insularis]|nr:hypothetical protein [Lambiella insularis]
MAHLITGNKFDPNKDIPDLNGKVYIVTGGAAGIGFGITAHLLQHNAAHVYLLGKRESHAEEAMKEFAKYGDAGKVEFRKCELEDLKQVDEIAKELTKLPKIDGVGFNPLQQNIWDVELTQLPQLVCNAGLGVGKYYETGDGIDSHMQVNHISQFHLTMILLPILQKTPNSRLVLQSSDLHRAAPPSTKFASLNEINTDIGPMLLYNRSKLAQVLFIRALARRLENGEQGFDNSKATGPFMNATHPGGVETDQQKQAVEAYGTLGKLGVAAIKPMMKDPVDEGCRPALFAAASDDIVTEKIQGQYIVPDRKVTEPSNQAKDVELGEQLWRVTEQILEQKLGPLSYAKH